MLEPAKQQSNPFSTGGGGPNFETRVQAAFTVLMLSGRLAYRGHSVTPYLLQSALMALENWLIAYAESSESEQLEWLFDYILRNSNSVMPTAVLASVATGFPEKVEKSALPLLRTAELYHMDRGRIIHERSGSEIDRHRSGFQTDALSKIYSKERRTAALRPWRGEHLETLIVRLQLSEWRDEVLAAIDLLRASEPQDETTRFLLHRIDSRGWKPIADKENNRIILKPKELEPDLKDIQQQTQEELQLKNRFSTLYIWARKIFEHEPLENEYYATWHESFTEAQELLEKFKADTIGDIVAMYLGGIITAAAVFIRDYSSELNQEQILWCTELIIYAVTVNADSDNRTIMADVTDLYGAAASASVLPILLDFVSDEHETFLVKKWIIIALTHVNENVRHKAAEGIRNYLWSRDSKFAKECIIGALEYARFEQDNRFVKRRIYSLESTEKEAEITKLQEKKDEFRERFANGEISNELEQITLQTHSSWYLLSPCLMIPDGSRETSHFKLLSNMLTIIFEDEQKKSTKYSEGDDQTKIHHKIPLKFADHFAKHLFHLHHSNFEDYIEQLQMGCEIAPDFISYLVVCVAVESKTRGKKEVYWQLWKELSQKIQELAIEFAASESRSRHQDNRRKLIRTILYADSPWQQADYESQDIVLGKELLLEFVKCAGKNPDVFEALASLVYHFRSIFFESGIYILSKHQKELGGTYLFSGVNTAFYLERAIQYFLQIDKTGLLPRNLHESCLVLLNAIVETASSRAYYLREHLIRSCKILESS